ncbi:hypothetical protein MTX35_11610 [Rhodococcus sp. ARC_M12]|uniref:hypothetical protein n=1 Tax=unclassified Rhodococcus (in: high G+C Gram-positive bacteria) TaxID=192944 RepID=UPI001FB54D2B|nr:MULTISPECIES: hypothetical protein [unclassified Rhodococcus (in: high G+C Gram-positive bacteria)]MCJ0892902.1 hypothetical protein [Rhodococcus sp. ARC_M5]MCJ0978354.1 hypothetical protein [Rhodococcus sp. ARC_M12]
MFGIEVSVGVASRHYLATQHLWTAQHAARLCGEVETALRKTQVGNVVEHRSHAVTAVLSSVAYLECLVNQVFQDVADTEQGQPNSRTEGITEAAQSLMRTLWTDARLDTKLTVIDKYQLALLCVGKPRLETGRDPVQSAALLVRLRNELVHFKPEWHDHADEHRFERQLKNRFADSRLPGDPWFPNKCLGAGCASWACDTASALAVEWWSRMGLTFDYSADMRDWANP